MSMMHNGFLRTMKANYPIDAGDISVIRPLVYCRESLMTEFAKKNNLPVVNENCPACFEEPKERARIKKLLSREETLYPNFYDNVRRSLIPLMHDDLSSILRSYTEEVLARSRKVPHKKHRVESERTKSNGETGTAASTNVTLLNATMEELIRELATRKARTFEADKDTGSSARDGPQTLDPTNQVCSRNGGDNSIPCYQLME